MWSQSPWTTDWPPENPLPTAYEDAWAAIKWVFSHSNGEGKEEWLRDYADFNRVFLAGDSAGGNICHQMGMKSDGNSVKLLGVVLINPYFWGEERIGSERSEECKFLDADLVKLGFIVCPSIEGLDEPFINPVAVGAPSLAGLGCKRVLVCVSEKDPLRERGWLYYEKLRESGWDGVAEITETREEGHVFHLFKPDSEKAYALMKRLASFVNQN